MKISTTLIRAAVIAAGYAAVTILIAPIAYGPIQFRISDILMPIPYLPYFGWAGVIGLTVGTIIANIVSPYGLWDMILGALSNFIGGLGAMLAYKIKNKNVGMLIAAMIPVLVVTFLIGFMLLYVMFGVPFILAVGGVFVGELVTAGIGGFLLIKRLDKVLGEFSVE
ncbi:MAG: QueT transporter family protein [Candidatus Njordarchaeota archaeon]